MPRKSLCGRRTPPARSFSGHATSSLEPMRRKLGGTSTAALARNLHFESRGKGDGEQSGWILPSCARNDRARVGARRRRTTRGECERDVAELGRRRSRFSRDVLRGSCGLRLRTRRHRRRNAGPRLRAEGRRRCGCRLLESAARQVHSTLLPSYRRRPVGCTSSPRRGALQRLRDWLAGRKVEVEERERIDLELPLFLLAAPSATGAAAEFETTMQRGNRWAGRLPSPARG